MSTLSTLSTLSEEEKKLFQVDTNLNLNIKNRHQRFISRSQFQPFIHHPSIPQTSIQVQRLSYLLKQYQSFSNLYAVNDDIKNLLIHQFISNGNIESSSGDDDLKYKYNVGMYSVHYVSWHKTQSAHNAQHISILQKCY